jgi:hypothetical protein
MPLKNLRLVNLFIIVIIYPLLQLMFLNLIATYLLECSFKRNE